MTTTDHPEQPSSRLDREIDEILAESRNRPISFQERVARKRLALQQRQRTPVARLKAAVGGPLATLGRGILRLPLIAALVLALIAVWLAPDFGIVATVLALAAAALIFAPFFFQRPSSDPIYRKTWRGRTIEPPRSSPTGGTGNPMRDWIDAVRRRFDR